MIDELENNDTTPVYGVVKWFDPAKGFGFVVAETGGPDILLHANVLRNFGQSSVADGSQISLSVQVTDRGKQAIEVFEITPPETDAIAGLSDFAEITSDELLALPLEPARVKWFDKAKGFGFANVFGLDADVFIHVEVLRRCGMADLQPGEAVCLRVIDGRRGRMAAEVQSWEMGVKEHSSSD